MSISGVSVPTVTPFIGNEIDWDGLGKNIEFLNGSGVNYIVALGSTGEFSSLTKKEQKKIIDFHAKHSRLPLIVGIAATAFEDSIELAEHAKKRGAIAVMACPPYFVRPNEDGLFKYYTALADKCKLPLILYNIPKFCGVSISPALALKLSSDPNIIAIKDSSGDMANLITMVGQLPAKFPVFIGSDTLMLSALLAGAQGATAGTANVAPSLVAEIFKKYKTDVEAAKKAHLKLMDVVAMNKVGCAPAGIKYGMDCVGLRGGNPRLPLPPLTEDEKKKIKALAERLKSD